MQITDLVNSLAFSLGISIAFWKGAFFSGQKFKRTFDYLSCSAQLIIKNLDLYCSSLWGYGLIKFSWRGKASSTTTASGVSVSQLVIWIHHLEHFGLDHHLTELFQIVDFTFYRRGTYIGTDKYIFSICCCMQNK